MEITNDLRSSLRANEDIVKNSIVLEPNCYADSVELLLGIAEDGEEWTTLDIIEIKLQEKLIVQNTEINLTATRDKTKLAATRDVRAKYECDSIDEIVERVAELVIDAGSPVEVSLEEFVSVLSYCGASVVTAMPSWINGGLLIEAHVDRGWQNSFDLLASQVETLDFAGECRFELLVTADLSIASGNVLLYSQVETPSIQPVLPWEGVEKLSNELGAAPAQNSVEHTYPSLSEVLNQKQKHGNPISKGVCENAISELASQSLIALASNPEPNQSRSGVSSDNWLLISIHSDSILVHYLPSSEGFFFELNDEYRFNDAFDIIRTAVQAGFDLQHGDGTLERIREKVTGRDIGVIDGLLMESTSGEEYVEG